MVRAAIFQSFGTQPRLAKVKPSTSAIGDEITGARHSSAAQINIRRWGCLSCETIDEKFITP